jgi:NitT/TauT family transport system permease protein
MYAYDFRTMSSQKNRSAALLRFAITIGCLIVIWELIRIIAIYLLDIPSFFFPNTYKILIDLNSALTELEVVYSLATTFLRILICTGIVALISLMVGVFLGVKNKLYYFLRPIWDILRSIPPSTLFPVFLIVFGIGVLSKMVIAVYFSTLILSLSIADSVKAVFEGEINVWKQIGVSRKNQIRFFFLPQVLYALFSSLRVVASIIVALLVITEMYLFNFNLFEIV